MWRDKQTGRTKKLDSLDEDDLVADCAARPPTTSKDSSYRSRIPLLIARGDATSNLATSSKYTTDHRVDSLVDSGFGSYRSLGEKVLSTGDSNIAYTRLSSTVTESFSSKTIQSDVENRSTWQHQRQQWLANEPSPFDYKPLIEPLPEQTVILGDVTEKIARLNIAEQKVAKQEEQLQTTPNVVGSSEVNSCYDLFKQDEDGDTILHLAIIHGISRLIETIIVKAPHPVFLNLQNSLSQTPLHLAVLVGMPRVVRALIIKGAVVDIRDRRGNTALHLACQKGDLACVEQIIKPLSFPEMDPNQHLKNLGEAWENYGQTQNLDLRNYEGQMCVHLATFCKSKEILELLYNFGADINAQEGKSGRTPLHFAIEMQEENLMEFIAGYCHADANVQTFAGFTPVHFAYMRNYDFVTRLNQYGAEDSGPPQLSDCESDSSSEELMMMENDCDFTINGEPLAEYCK